jgi:glycogen debranching enzyme
MRMNPEQLTDRGCWISDDRVYAFVSSEKNGIGEIGYHGEQPVSRNSRVFAGKEPVCTFAVVGADNEEFPILFREFDWCPGGVRVHGEYGRGEALLDVAVSGRILVVACTVANQKGASLRIRFSKNVWFTEVQGTRTWKKGSAGNGSLTLGFRDRMVLNEWMNKEGPYAGDFLIPEPVRRTIFSRRCRSGLAKRDDLLPEYRDAALSLYDAGVSVRIGGKGFLLEEGHDAFVFTARLLNEGGAFPLFVIVFDEEIHPPPEDAELRSIPARARTTHGRLKAGAPVLRIPGYPQVEKFFATVPGLVESCIIRDHGVPRATPGAYYWIWAWDAMVTCLAALRWGNTGVAGDTTAFVNMHRDEGRYIPMRWTRSLVPLDTQPRGALEVLLASLAYATFRETGDTRTLPIVYPHVVRHFEEISATCDSRGLFANSGFYPDIPARFSRTETSAVALEIAGFYTFCRTCENIARVMGDESTAQGAVAMARRIEDHFLKIFWSEEHGFLIDGLDLSTGTRNISFPLFTFLFLHSPLGISLIRPKLAECADFIVRHLLTPAGLRLLPSWDINAGSETVSGAWYPHWDVYALKILRRAGREKEILLWLDCVERVLNNLGYCPEYLSLDAFDGDNPDSWRRHGSPSNLNCVTGWYAALIEGLFGIEIDGGGMTIIPLALPIGEMHLTGLRFRGARTDVRVQNRGPFLQELRVNGRVLRGCCKLPPGMIVQGENSIEIVYGPEPPGWCFREIVNAEVLDVHDDEDRLDIRVRAYGAVDLHLFAPVRCELLLDNVTLATAGEVGTHSKSRRLFIHGDHALSLVRR